MGIRTRCKSANSTTDLQPYDMGTKPQVNSLRTGTMAKSKNSSQHNQAKKAHKNGIKKPKTLRYPSLEGTDPKFRRNHRHALHGTMKALKEVKEGKRDTA